VIYISKPYITEAEKKAVMEVLDSGYIVQGPKTAKLEEAFAEVCGTEYAVATSSGTTALHIALLAHGIGEGDEVITTPFTFMASINTILFVGAKPVFVDIQADTFNLDPELIEAAITPKTKAILPVHLYGQPCEMDRMMEMAREHDLVVIEDAAQAIGATFEGQPVGSFGTGCFSLYATKNVMSAEGGMITTNDPDLAQECRMLRNHGMQRRYHHDMLGYNFRMTDIHAAIGLTQIGRLEELTSAREKNAAYLNAHITSVVTPVSRPNVRHVWHQYTIRMDGGRDRDAAVLSLKEAGVGTGIFYPIPAYRQAHMVEMGFGEERYPITEQMVKEVISLPVHPLLSEGDLETIAQEVNKL
jgi:dTDP-4-amino-4,6-dideoxygalactose transaminase